MLCIYFNNGKEKRLQVGFGQSSQRLVNSILYLKEIGMVLFLMTFTTASIASNSSSNNCNLNVRTNSEEACMLIERGCQF